MRAVAAAAEGPVWQRCHQGLPAAATAPAKMVKKILFEISERPELVLNPSETVSN